MVYLEKIQHLFSRPISKQEMELPWCFQDQTQELIKWQARIHQFIGHYQTRIENIEKELTTRKELTDLNRRRLRRVKKALSENKSTISKLLAEIIQAETHEVIYKTVDPQSIAKDIDIYLTNIFRDWAWNNGENKDALNLVKQVWDDGFEQSDVAVLGAGAGRLAYDLAREFNCQNLILIDNNPLLLHLADRMIAGEELTLYELPLTPENVGDVAVEHQLKAPNRDALSSCYCVLADVLDLPLKEESLDVIVTPWLVDVIEDDFKDFSRRLRKILKPGGQWIHLGPFGFDPSQEAKCYSTEEVLEAVKKSGFDLNQFESKSLPYLQSPYSGYGRVERVTCFRATKNHSRVSDAPKFAPIPSWLKDFDQPIPKTDFITDACFRNRIHAEVLGAINGQLSFNQIVELMQQHYKMTEQQATEALWAFLQKVI